jgi:hypothetical protein
MTKAAMLIKQGGKPVCKTASRLYLLCQKGDTQGLVSLYFSLSLLCLFSCYVDCFCISSGYDVFGCYYNVLFSPAEAGIAIYFCFHVAT